jgi:hypothetical protein
VTGVASGYIAERRCSATIHDDDPVRSAAMTTYPGEDDGLEATEVPATPHSAMDPDPGPLPEADAPDADAAGGTGPGNADPGF